MMTRWLRAILEGLAALFRWLGLVAPQPPRVELRVPDDYATVQAAVDAPARGAVITVAGPPRVRRAPPAQAARDRARRWPGAATLHCDENTVLVVEGEQAACAARGLRFETAIGGCFGCGRAWARASSSTAAR